MSKIVYLDIKMQRRLRALLVESGKTIEIVAEEMGVSRPTLSARINGRIDFNRSEMKSFAISVGKRPEEIFFSE